MKILITGGAGFIGSHLCNYLLKKITKYWQLITYLVVIIIILNI